MKLVDMYPLMAAIIIVSCVIGMLAMIAPKQPQSDIRASVSRGDPEKGKFGEFILTVYDRWGKDVVVFHDIAIDQELNFIDIDKMSVNIDGSLEWTAEPNFPGPETWKERYQEARYEYITGRKPKSPSQ
jgi:hypothetical protein